MTTLYAALAADTKRNDMIFDVVLQARLRHVVLTSLQAGRRPVILTERRDHLDHLRFRFEKFTRNLVVLYGGMNAGERRAAEAGLKTPDGVERLVLATGRTLGEGFDDASLDTLFLSLWMKFWAHLVERHARPVGHLHREHHAKPEVIVYDYVDGVTMLARMALKRQVGYRSLGYEIGTAAAAPAGQGMTPNH